jgi:DNA-binding CsgD family transcriptional regulator
VSGKHAGTIAQLRKTGDLDRILDTLSDREARIIRLRYGLGRQAPMTLREIGMRLGLTGPRISQLEQKAILKLQHPSRNAALRTPAEADSADEDIESKDARWGKRMVEIRVRFWTDKIAEGKGRIVPKHAWDTGIVRIDSNVEHGISPKPPRPFNSLAELPSKIEQVLIDHGVTLHLNRRSSKVLAPRPDRPL